MRYIRTLVCTIATLGLASSAAAGELRIGVVDFHRAFMSFTQREALQKELDAKKKEMEDKLAKLESSLKSKQADLETLKPGTEDYRQFQLKLIELEALTQVSKRQFDLELETLRRTHMEDLLDMLAGVIRAYAEENQIDLILSRYIGDARIGGPHHIVLYCAPTMDITDQIIARLNRKATK